LDATGHILVVDDDAEIRDLLSRFLRKHGYRVSSARNGIEMRAALATPEFDLVVLDVMMPGEDGVSLCRDLRARSALPVIMLTAMGEEADRIVGLEVGADDYLSKPFSPRELLARMRAVLRRSAGGLVHDRGKTGTLCFAGWTMDLVRRELRTPAGVAVDLTSGEFDLLAVLTENPRRVLSRDHLLDATRGRSASPYDRSIDNQVSRLRRKLEHAAPGEEEIIKTVRGAGYVLSAAVERL